ncbi:MAG: hypothetical protein HOL01_03070 [Planctomycetaceae bacterium]|jgi:hypothetical protein|nr:hypothetical protein [Planctomycetaceae bacterium]
MFTQAGSMLLLSSVFFCEGPRQDFDVTVKKRVEATVGVDSGKSFQTTQWNTHHFPDKPPAWIKMGWMWSADSISNVIHQGFIDLPIPTRDWHNRIDWGGAYILGEPAADNP